MKSKGVLSDVHIAFSRVGPKKVYVQHNILANEDAVWDLMYHSYVLPSPSFTEVDTIKKEPFTYVVMLR